MRYHTCDKHPEEQCQACEVTAPTARELLDEILPPPDDAKRAAPGYIVGCAETLASRVEKVLALHFRGTSGAYCYHCSYDWPCPTVRALNEEEE